MQLVFIAALDAEFADVIGAFVVGRKIGDLDILHVRFVYAPNMPDGMGRDFAVRVLPEQARANLKAGETIAVDRKARDLGFGKPVANRQ